MKIAVQQIRAIISILPLISKEGGRTRDRLWEEGTGGRSVGQVQAVRNGVGHLRSPQCCSGVSVGGMTRPGIHTSR